MRRFFAKLALRARALWLLALNEHATPAEIGWAVGVGVFVGCSPFLGLHGWIAVGVATLLRLNRLWAFLGSRVCTIVVLAWIAMAEIELAHRVRTGAWLPLRPATVFQEGRALILDWCLGALVIGALLGLLVGAAAYMIARRKQRP